MAYPGIALVAMVGVGLGLALWYLLSEPTSESPHSSGRPPSRGDSPSPTNSWEKPTEGRRRRPRSNSKAKDDCAICTESLEDSAVTVKCGHLFHAQCIRQWRDEVARSQNGNHQNIVPCPLCRSTI